MSRNYAICVPRWILTAAHCLKNKMPTMVSMGIDEYGESSNCAYVSPNKQYIHPKYSKLQMQPYDIGKSTVSSLFNAKQFSVCVCIKRNQLMFFPYSTGLIKLFEDITPNERVQPIQLPTECGDDLENIDVIAVGAGLTKFSGMLTEVVIRHAYLKTMSADDCRNTLNNFSMPNTVICAPPNNGQCVSHGDSGESM